MRENVSYEEALQQDGTYAVMLEGLSKKTAGWLERLLKDPYYNCAPFDEVPPQIQASNWAKQRESKSLKIQAVALVHENSGELTDIDLVEKLGISLSEFNFKNGIRDFLIKHLIRPNEHRKFEYPFFLPEAKQLEKNKVEIF